jgi:hypothetical protein
MVNPPSGFPQPSANAWRLGRRGVQFLPATNSLTVIIGY